MANEQVEAAWELLNAFLKKESKEVLVEDNPSPKGRSRKIKAFLKGGFDCGFYFRFEGNTGLVLYAQTQIVDVASDNMNSCYDLAMTHHEKTTDDDGIRKEFIPTCTVNGKEVSQNDIDNGLIKEGEIVFCFQFTFGVKMPDNFMFRSVTDYICRKRYDYYTLFCGEALKGYSYDETMIEFSKERRRIENGISDMILNLVLEIARCDWEEIAKKKGDKIRVAVFSLLNENDAMQRAVCRYTREIIDLDLYDLVYLIICDDKRDIILRSLFSVVFECLKVRKGKPVLVRNKGFEESLRLRVKDSLREDPGIYEDPGEEYDDPENPFPADNILEMPGIH